MKISGEGPRFEFVPAIPDRALPAVVSPDGSGASFSAALKGIGRAVDQGEALISRASRGDAGSFDSAQLIALQVGIYRYSEAVDLLAKLVDRASTAVKAVVSPHS